MYRKVLTLLNIYVEKKDKQPENSMYITWKYMKINGIWETLMKKISLTFVLNLASQTTRNNNKVNQSY